MRRFTALVNPISGGGTAAARFEPLAARLRDAGADVTVVATRGQEHAVEAATSAAAAGDVVAAVGGDGLVRDVATGVVRSSGTMAIVPAGRGNDLALGLGIPHGIAQLAELLLHGPVRALDVLEANGVLVPGNVYTGLDAVATKIINDNRRLPARLLYRLAPVLALVRWRPAQFRVEHDAGATVTRGHMVVLANSGRYGHGLHIVPTAVPDDGQIDVLTIGAVPKYKVATFMGEAKTGTHVQRPEVTVTRAARVTISADRPVPVCADGDQIGELPITVTVHPGALNLIAPLPR